MRRATSTSRVLPALLAAVVVSIVLGILGMHGLDAHGATSSTDHATMSSPMAGSHANLSVVPAVDDTAGVTTTVPDGGNGHDMGDMGDMVMLCVAMLAAGAGALLLLLSLRRVPRIWASLPAPATVTGWVTARLGAGPPPAWEFSVIRC